MGRARFPLSGSITFASVSVGQLSRPSVASNADGVCAYANRRNSFKVERTEGRAKLNY